MLRPTVGSIRRDTIRHLRVVSSPIRDRPLPNRPLTQAVAPLAPTGVFNVRETGMRPSGTNFALAAVAAALTTGIAIAGSQAATIAALQDGTSIAWIDTDKKKVTKTVKLSGGAKLVGIDVRPADGKLYGVTPHRHNRRGHRQMGEEKPDFREAADRRHRLRRLQSGRRPLARHDQRRHESAHQCR